MAREMRHSGIDWIGDIPNEWSIGRVKDGFYRKKQDAHQDDPVILSLARSGVKIRDISSNEGQIAESYYNYNVVNEGDLLLNPMDLYSGANCSISRVSGVISQAYINLGAKKGFISEYYDYYFKTQYWAMALFAHGKGVSFDNRWTLGLEDLMRYYIPIPPTDEQERIANFLLGECRRIDSVIKETRDSIDEYKKLKQSVIVNAVTKGLRGQRPMENTGIDWIGDIPKNWNCTTIGRIATVVRGASPRPAGDPMYFNGSFIPWITVSEVTNGYGKYITSTATCLTEEGSKRSRLVEAGTLLLSNSGATLGVPKITKIQGCINDGSVAFYNLQIEQDYLLYVFAGRTLELRKQMQGYGQPNLNTTIVKGLSVPLPPKEEQIEIATYLDKITAEIDALIIKKEKLVSELDNYKKAIITEYVTGKKEVPA